MTVKISDLRERVTLQSCTRAPDGAGGFTEDWQDRYSVWAAMQPFMNKMRITSYFGDEVSDIHLCSYKMRVRHGIDISREMRISWGSDLYKIITEPIPDPSKRWIEIIIRKIRKAGNE